jgi:D-alanyl-D-alanine dipeptidase
MNLMDVIELSKKKCVLPIQAKLAYATSHNLVGRPLNGYHVDALDICLLTPKAANALCQVQNDLVKQYQMGLFIYDTYRPKRAVLDLMRWAKTPAASDNELHRKKLHYPHLEKNQLFNLGYIAEDSNHCYGNTVDLVLIDLQTQQLLDMGAIFDYMDQRSHLTATIAEIGETAYRHRRILVDAMEKLGFHPYEKEYWHFCHGGRAGSEVNAPLDIEITPLLKGIGVIYEGLLT